MFNPAPIVACMMLRRNQEREEREEIIKREYEEREKLEKEEKRKYPLRIITELRKKEGKKMKINLKKKEQIKSSLKKIVSHFLVDVETCNYQRIIMELSFMIVSKFYTIPKKFCFIKRSVGK